MGPLVVLVLALLIDATLVRAVLLPATMKLYLQSKLQEFRHEPERAQA